MFIPSHSVIIFLKLFEIYKMDMGHNKRLFSIFTISILSVVLFTGALSIPGFTSQSNQVINDSNQKFTFGLIQYSFGASHPSYSDVTGYTSSLELGFDGTNYSTAFNGTVTTTANIPQSPDSYINSTLAFGYTWTLTTDPMQAAIAMIHVSGVDPSSPSVWHTHTATIESTSDCAGVGSGKQLTNLQAPADTQITISDNSLNLWMLKSAVANSYESLESFQLLEPTSGVLCLAAP